MINQNMMMQQVVSPATSNNMASFSPSPQMHAGNMMNVGNAASNPVTNLLAQLQLPSLTGTAGTSTSSGASVISSTNVYANGQAASTSNQSNPTPTSSKSNNADGKEDAGSEHGSNPSNHTSGSDLGGLSKDELLERLAKNSTQKQILPPPIDILGGPQKSNSSSNGAVISTPCVSPVITGPGVSLVKTSPIPNTTTPFTTSSNNINNTSGGLETSSNPSSTHSKEAAAKSLITPTTPAIVPVAAGNSGIPGFLGSVGGVATATATAVASHNILFTLPSANHSIASAAPFAAVNSSTSYNAAATGAVGSTSHQAGSSPVVSTPGVSSGAIYGSPHVSFAYDGGIERGLSGKITKLLKCTSQNIDILPAGRSEDDQCENNREVGQKGSRVSTKDTTAKEVLVKEIIVTSAC